LSYKISDECYILGNGPSLKADLQNNINTIKDHVFIAKSEYYTIIKPSFYVFADDVYWSPDIFIDTSNNCKATLNSIKIKTTWPLTIFIPNIAYKSNVFQKVFLQNKNIDIVSYNLTPIKSNDIFKYIYFKNNLGMPQAQNVLISCLFIAINLNFKKINLLGADHSWCRGIEVNRENQVCFIEDHFYDTEEQVLIPFRKGNGEIFKMHEILFAFKKMFEGYWEIKKYAIYRNVNILNRSSISFIDAFEKRPL
jgi:hypothetical protein